MNLSLERMLLSLPAVVIGLTVHEYCHALAANALGDSTAKDEGRLTLNPLRHLDPLGMLFIVILGFGWARPVRFDPSRLAKPRRDRALIALAGPASNLVLGLLCLGALKLLALSAAGGAAPGIAVFTMLLYMALINLGLFAFNILPIPPLDGSHVLFSGLDLEPETQERLMRYGNILLLALILIKNRTGLDLLPIGGIRDFIVGWFF